MAYSSNLKTWGDSGVEFPDGHAHAANSGHVDAYENFFKHNAIADILWLIDEVNGSTNTSVSEDDASVASDVADINFVGPVNVQDDQDGTVTVNLSHNHDSRYLLKDPSGAVEPITLADGDSLFVEEPSSIYFTSPLFQNDNIAMRAFDGKDLVIKHDGGENDARIRATEFATVDLHRTDSLILPQSPSGGSIAPTQGDPAIYWDTDDGELRLIDESGIVYRVELTAV